MSLPEVDGAFYPTEAEVRDQLLRTVRLAYLRRGKKVNVLPGSDYFITCTAMARVVAIAFANSKVALRDVSPLTATGDNLRKLSKAFGVAERPPSGSSGFLKVKCTGTVVIPASYAATAPNGKKYATTAATTVASGQVVAVVAVDAGADTNQDGGTILSWDSAAVGALAATAVVEAGGITGGSDGDDEETLRERLLMRLAFPGAGGNWSQVKGWAEDVTAAVEAAYVYPAARGPGSVDIAVTKARGDRALSPTVVAEVAAHVAANIPGFASLNVTSVQRLEVDVTIVARLPLPTFAGGAGGGFRDAAPWPTDDARIVAVAGAQLDVLTAGTPTLGARIGLWDPASKQLTEFTITSAPASIAGGWRFTIAPTSGGAVPAWLAPGMYVSAGAVNLVSYAQTVLAEFEKLGPGEKSASPDVLPRALRKPPSDVIAPSALTSLLLAGVTNNHPEIMSLNWGARRISGTATLIESPPVPMTAADPPYVLVLKHLALCAG
jgi:uncharacterized phage protein gp47/JayE